ncbi:MAG: ATP-binding cassette domain-containing protein, partial [Bacteroidota bacterium]
MPGTILHIDNLSKSYGHIKAVQNLALSIDRGNVFGILGPNGSGKTTTLSIVLGIVRPDAGHFTWFEGVDLREAKKRTGSLVETPNFYPYLSGEQNLKIVCDIRQVPYKDIDRVLKIVNLHQRGRSKYFTYSYGMKQRLALASLLLGDPEVLILDEPTNGLDPEGIAEVRRIISAEAEKGKTVIMASHILDEVEKVCSHVAILKKGELVSCGRVSELLG